MNPFLRNLTWFARRSAKEAELQDEFEFHLDEEAGERAATGCEPAQAH